jgi:DNA-binding SARP family transcriptional activator
VARPTSQLHLALLGPPEASLGKRTLKFPTRKTLALLAYLAAEGGEQQREHLAALLWPEASTQRSHASLRNTLGHLQASLRRASGREQTTYVAVTHGALALNPEAGINVDLQTVERAYAQARADRSGRSVPKGSASQPLLQAAAALYRGDFLAGFSLGDAAGFDDWVGTQREVWRRRLGLILDRLSEIQFAGGEFASTAETTALWIALDALNERAYRRKMRAHFAAGERGQALETYAACRAILAEELQAEPEPDTVALAEHIRTQYPPSGAVPLQQPPDTPVGFLESLFAGRAAEQQVLVERYGLAMQRQAQVLTLHGEAGIGKTRLANEFLAWSRAQGAEVIEARAFEGGSRMPFQPLAEALRLRLKRADGLKDWPDSAWLAPLSQLLPELRERYPGLSPAPAESAAGRPRLFEPLVRLMLALAGPAPLVLFVDDLQWADSATLEMLQYAARRWREDSARVLLLFAVRSEAMQPSAQRHLPNLNAWLAQVERELQPYHLQLGPLGQKDTLELVRSILAPPAADFAQWAFDETHGQPFYLMETLKDLLERGVLHPRRRTNGRWAFAVDAEHNLGHAALVPSTVRAVIRARLDRLSPNASALLAAGAALGRDLTFDRLCAIAKVPEDVGLPALDELLSSRLLLEVVEPGGASAYDFANDMLRDVVYTEAGDARRRLFHRRALEVLTAAGEPAAVLAHHALAAGQTDAAVRYSLSAGQEALRLSAASEARVHLEQARNLAQQGPPVRAEFEGHIRDLYAQLGRAFELDGQPEQASAIYAELERLALRRTSG